MENVRKIICHHIYNIKVADSNPKKLIAPKNNYSLELVLILSFEGYIGFFVELSKYLNSLSIFELLYSIN